MILSWDLHGFFFLWNILSWSTSKSVSKPTTYQISSYEFFQDFWITVSIPTSTVHNVVQEIIFKILLNRSFRVYVDSYFWFHKTKHQELLPGGNLGYAFVWVNSYRQNIFCPYHEIFFRMYNFFEKKMLKTPVSSLIKGIFCNSLF